MTDAGLRKLRLYDADPFPDYMGGYLRHYTKLGDDPESALIHTSELHQISSLAVKTLRNRGYDLDGIRASFWLYEFWDFENPQATICGDLGDEYKWEPNSAEDNLFGVIRRVLPRFSIDPHPTPWPPSWI